MKCLGTAMEEYVYHLADTHFFFTDLEVRKITEYAILLHAYLFFAGIDDC